MPGHPNIANLKAGDLAGFGRDHKGRIETSRAEMGRTHALEILNNEDYRNNLKARMVAGEGGAIEVWLWRIGYGDPAKPKEDGSEDEARFLRIREKLRSFMMENPDEARVMAALLARGPRALLEPSPAPVPDADPEAAS